MTKPISQEKGVVCIIENFTHRRIAEKEMKRIVQQTVRSFSNAEKKKSAALRYLYIYVVGVLRGAQLNKKFRGIKKPTDVLSFPPEAGQPWVDEDTSQSKIRHGIGEIVLCPQVVEQHAKKLHRSFQNEWAHVLVHGTLHVLGHHHEKSAAHERKLQKEENSICKTLGYGIPHIEL